MMGITDGDKEILLSAVRPCEMKVLLNEALFINGYSHLTIGYLLRTKWRDLEFESYG